MNLRRIFLFIALIIMLMFFHGNLTSQDNAGTDEDEFVEEGMQIENPNTKEFIAKAINFFDRANRTADKDSALNDRIEGLTRLQEILTQQKYRDDVVYNQTDKIYQGARVYVRQILESRGSEILDLYKTRYEKIAASRIQNAIYNKNIDILKNVIRMYPYTDSAIVGAIQASRILIEQNKLPEAASIMSKLLYQNTFKDSRKTALVAQLAFSYEQLLWDYELEKLLAYTRKNLPDARFKLGHKFVDLPSYIDCKLAEALKRKNSPNYSEVFNKDGGNPANNKIVHAVTDPEEFRWSKTHPRAVIGPYEPNIGLNYSYYEGNLKRIFPSVSDATVFVPFRNNLTAYNLYSGVEKWAYSKRYEFGHSWIQRIDSAVIYTVSCDKNQVYAPIESYVPNHLLENRTSRPFFYGPAIVIPPKRELVCFDKHNGDVMWRVGAKWDNSLPLHEILSYPIAPTVIDDTAYVIGCTLTANAHFFLLAFDINGEFQDGKRTGNGKLKWIAKIATGQQEINMFGRPIREPIPQGLAYMDNKIIACTNVGLISAFDADTGERIWAQLYDKIPYISTKSNVPNFRRLTWFNRPPIIYKGKVIVAPLDSSKMYCYDIESGKLLWNYRYNPYNSSSRYLIGVFDDKVIFGGSKYLFAIDIKSGRLTTALDLYEESRIIDFKAAGKPVIMSNLCIIPTRTSIMHVDLKEMKVIKVSRNNDYSASIIDISSMGGNLIAAENTLISVNSSNIAVAYDRKNLFKRLVSLEKKYPKDLEIKYRIGVLLLENNKNNDAIIYFKKILTEYKKNKKSTFNHIVTQTNRTLFSIYYKRAKELYRVGKFKELSAYISIAKQYSQTKDEYIGIMLID
ncbi:MAG: PQQ-binding-like beta-propeller repeat protein, partial [Planctomycetes bacterium]|nr:PQQ-binding-like beta-propeller repeat protein [Planctomycetota bacterium]